MTAKRSTLRIIGGQHRGRRLQFVDQNGDLRPTSDRMRETLFNWLQFELQGSRVLDLFSGSGSLGAEALSRGAAYALLVEKKAERAADLSRQLKPIFEKRVFIRQADAMTVLKQPPEQGFDVVFVDPPYHLNLQQLTCDLLHNNGWLNTGAWIYVETGAHDPAPNCPHWIMEKEKTMGEATARLYRNP